MPLLYKISGATMDNKSFGFDTENIRYRYTEHGDEISMYRIW